MPWSPPEVHPSDGFYTHVVHSDASASDADMNAFEGSRPLVALLGQTLTELTIDYESRAEASAAVTANVLRVVGTGIVAIGDLPTRTGLSREGITMAVGFMERTGLATSAPGRLISLSPKGALVLDGYRSWATRGRLDVAQCHRGCGGAGRRALGRLGTPGRVLAWRNALFGADTAPCR